MLQIPNSADVPRRLRSINFLLVRGIVLALATILAVAGVSALVRHLLRPENIAKARLQRDGYAVSEAAVFQAIARDDSLALVRFKTARVSLLALNEKGWTPYEVALRNDQLDLLDTLAGLEAVPKLAPKVLEECFVQALQRDALDTAAFLLKRGVSPDVEVEPGLPALVWSMMADKEKAVDFLLKNKANIKLGSKAGTPLVLSYTQGNFGLFDRFLSMGADPDQLDMNGRGLGALSVQDDRVDFTRRLLKAGVDVNKAGAKDGLSMLEAAFRLRKEAVFLELVGAGGKLSSVDAQGRTFLARVTEERDYHWMECLLSHGVNPNQRISGKGDPLWWSSYQHGDPRGAELLLGRGADINSVDGSGVKPIDLAIQRDSYPVTRYLFAHGAKTSDKLWGLLESKNYDLLRLVVANGADVLKRNAAGLTPLSFAIRRGDVTGAGLLMEYGARYEKAERPDGHSLLEWALAHRELPIAEFLVKQGAAVNEPVQKLHADFLGSFKGNGTLQFHLKGDSNVTPLMIAAGSHQMDMARFLLAHGAKRYQWTKRYRTDPVTFAIRADDLPMAQLMLGREPDVDGNYQRKIVVSRNDQRARFYKDGELVYSTQCSTGKSGYRTPGGTFVITDKSRLRYSSLYGAAMPYFHRLSGSAVGMHEGYVPGYPASHGCIRLPSHYARIFFEHTKVGDIVVVE